MQGLSEDPFRTGRISYNLCYQLICGQCFMYVETRLSIFTSEKFQCFFKCRCSTLTHVLFIHDTNVKQATGFSISGALAANGLSIINRRILFTGNISIITTVTGIVCSTTCFLKMEYL